MDIASLKIEELLRSPNFKSFLKEEPTVMLRRLNIEEILGKIKKNAEEMIDQLTCSKSSSCSDLVIGKIIGKSQVEEL